MNIQSLDRRSFIKIVGCSALATAIEGLLSGCGGGGGGGGGPAKPIIKPGVVVLPSDGSVTIVNASSTQIVLSGNVPNLAPGAVIVSGVGQGLIAKVTSASTSGTTTTAQVVAATCEDIFSSASVKLQKSLAFSDFATVTPELSGVTVTAPMLRRATTSAGNGFQLNFGDVEVSADISIQGSATVEFTLNDSLNWDANGLASASFVPTATITGQLVISGTITAELSNKVRYLHMVGTPQVVFIDLLPIVFVPVFDFYFVYDAEATGTASFTSTVSETVSAGLQYTRAGGWQPVTSPPTTSTSFVPAASFTAELSITPVHIEYSELIYGIAGPTAFVDLPTLAAELTINPPSHSVNGYLLDVTATADLSAGYTVQVLGKTLADSPVTGSLSKAADIFDQFYPDTSITVNAKHRGVKK